MNIPAALRPYADPVPSPGPGVPLVERAFVFDRKPVIAVALGTTLAPLSSTMIAVALPGIQRSLGASVTSTAWLVTLYLVAMAIGQPIGGRLGDTFGRKTLYLAGLTGFAIASIGCALSPGLFVLIGFRTSQAIAGALTFPNGIAMLRETTPSERRASTFGAIGLATGLAAAAGPPLGGLLVTQFGWHAIFWVNLPVIALAVVLGWRCLPASTQSRSDSLDLRGAVWFAATLTGPLAVPALIKVGHSEIAVVAAATGLCSGVVFVRWERAVASPLIDPALFRKRVFAAACGSILLSNLVMYTSLLALPLYLERARGYDARLTGALLAVMSALSALLGPAGGRWADRAGRRAPAVIGAAALAGGAAGLTFSIVTESLGMTAVSLALLGAGLGIAAASVQAAAMDAAPAGRSATAAGLFSTARYLGSVIGASVLALLFMSGQSLQETGRFTVLFVGLTLAALAGIACNRAIVSDAGERTGSL